MQQTVSNRGNTTGTLASLPVDHIEQLRYSRPKALSKGE